MPLVSSFNITVDVRACALGFKGREAKQVGQAANYNYTALFSAAVFDESLSQLPHTAHATSPDLQLCGWDCRYAAMHLTACWNAGIVSNTPLVHSTLSHSATIQQLLGYNNKFTPCVGTVSFM